MGGRGKPTPLQPGDVPGGRKNIPAAALLVTCLAFAFGYLSRGCGLFPGGADSPGGPGKEKEKVEAPKDPQEREKPGKDEKLKDKEPVTKDPAPKGETVLVKVVLRDDKIFLDGREISWVDFNIEIRKAYQTSRLVELVVHSRSLSFGFLRRAEHDLGQVGVQYFVKEQ